MATVVRFGSFSRRQFLSLGLAGLFFLVGAEPARAALPTAFTLDTIATGFDRPTAVAFAPDGRVFVAQKDGIVWVVKNGVRLTTPFLSLRGEVNRQGDRGLLGMTLDPNFAQNGRMYLLYVIEPIPGDPQEADTSASYGRLTRYTASGDVADTASRKILLGNSPADGMPICYTSHAIGTVKFAFDGTLFVGAGEGAHWDRVDTGQDTIADDAQCAQMFGAALDRGALRAQLLDSLSGKILRIDADTGLGLASNPFFDGNTASVRSRIWAMGLRNPFRFNLRAGSPSPGTIYLGDVGWETYEEVNVARGGENFGWPCYEGPNPQPVYQADPVAGPFCQQNVPLASVTFPLYPSPHNNLDRALGGVVQYNGNRYPSKYKGAFFLTDYAQDWMKVLFVDANNQLLSVEDFGTGFGNAVDLETDPVTGDIYVVSIVANELRRLRFTTANLPPTVVAGSDVTAGGVPLTVHFSSNGTFDRDGDPFTLDWDFGDGTAHSSAANPTHIYMQTGAFVARLTATDNLGNSDSATVSIQTRNNPPTVRITSPMDGYRFQDGELIQLTADANDPEEGLNVLYSWHVDTVHQAHIHFDTFESTDAAPTFTAVAHGTTGERYSYRVTLTVTDGGGLTATAVAYLVPVGLTNQAPVAAFTMLPASGSPPLNVAFDASTTNDPDGDLVTYAWDFGDGTTGSGVTTTHIYDQSGTYNVALIARDILGATGTRTATVVVQDTGLVGFWKLDEGMGAAAADSSGRGNNCSLVGGTWSAGKLGQALFFNGTTSSAGCGAGSSLALAGNLTVAAWIKIADANRSAYMRIISKKTLWSATNGYSLGYNPLRNLLEFHGSGSDSATATVDLDTGWHHVAAVAQGTQVRLYVDGIDRTTEGVASAVVAGTAPLFLGRDGAGNFYSGGIDDVRLFSRALTAPEIQALVSSTPPPVNQPPVPVNASVSTTLGTPVAVTLAATDPEGGAVTFAVATQPLHGTLSGTAPNLTFTPAAGFSGGDSFTFRATDPANASAIGAITLNVTAAANQPPTANSASVSTPQGTPVAVTLTGTDPEGGALTFTVVTSPAHGTLTGTPPSLTYSPAAGFSGGDSFTFRTTDSGNASSPVATITLTVTPTTPPDNSGLVARWPFAENTGITTKDATANAISCSLSATTWAAGKFDSALSFNGTSSSARCGAPAVLNVTGSVTIAAWIRITNADESNYMRIVSKKTAWDATSGYALTYNPLRNLLEVHGSGNNSGAAANVNLDTGWHHVAATISGTTAKLYVDGVDRTTDASVSALANGTTALVIGREPNGTGPFHGLVDEVRVYNRALSAAEVAGLVGFVP